MIVSKIIDLKGTPIQTPNFQGYTGEMRRAGQHLVVKSRHWMGFTLLQSLIKPQSKLPIPNTECKKSSLAEDKVVILSRSAILCDDIAGSLVASPQETLTSPKMPWMRAGRFGTEGSKTSVIRVTNGNQNRSVPEAGLM